MLPSKLQACFDVRLDNEKDPQEFEDMVREWCQEAGNGVTYDLVKEAEMNFKTSLDDGNPYWGAMLQAAKKLNFRIRREINPATADIKFMRMVRLTDSIKYKIFTLRFFASLLILPRIFLKTNNFNTVTSQLPNLIKNILR